MRILLLTFFLAAATSATASRIEIDIEELLEMVPYEQMVNLGMEYAIADPQVKSLMQYISGDKFKENVLSLQSSPQFVHLAEVSSTYHIDAFSLANKFNSALDLPPLSYKIAYTREKRSPGDGVAGLVKEAAELTPLEEMKVAYKYKVDHNPELKLLMSKLLSGEAKQVLEPIFKSKPFQDTKHDLKEMGIPLDQLEEMLVGHLHKFFDLNAKVEPLSVPQTN
uniref:Protein G12 n=3 Tax=Lygus hesperus TaxID=30085 RepID=A0A0K8T3Z4_LYGHE